MFNRKYKKGMADAAKAYEAFGKKQEEALRYILEEVRQGKRDMQSALKEIDGHIDNIYDYLKSKEKAALYTVYTPFDLKELGEKERLFLVGALFRLTMDKVPNEDQQNYLRAVQKYLEIKEPPFGTDPMAIENIEDLPTQKAILQAVLEFLRLQDGDSYDETELQQEFLDAFSVNNKGRQEIMEHIELLYTATGAKGLAEKYGYVPEEEEPEATTEPDDPSSTSPLLYVDPEFVELQSDYADNVVKNTIPVYSCTETRNYCFLLPKKICLDKRNGSILSFNHLPKCRINEARKVECIPDAIVFTGYDRDRESYFVGLFDLAEDRYTEIDHSGKFVFLLCAQGQYIVYGNYRAESSEIFTYDVLSKRLFTIPKPPQAVANSGYDLIAGISENYLYLSAQANESSCNLYQVNLISEDLSGQLVTDFTIPRISSGILKVCGEWLYMIDYSEGGSILRRGGIRGRLGRIEHLQIFKGNLKNKTVETLVCIIDDPAAKQKVYPSWNNICDQYMTYRIEKGKICLLEFETGKIQELVPCSKTWSRQVFLDSRDWAIHLNRFPILGKWMYFEKENDDHIYKVDINHPGQIQILNN